MKGSGKYTYAENQSEYVIQLKKRRYWWLLMFLLLLLPLLLLIRIKKDVHIKVVDSYSEVPLPSSLTKFGYIDYTLFGKPETINLSDTTDQNGIAIYEKVSYTLYSLLFHQQADAWINASNECFLGDSLITKFHDLKDKQITIIKLPPRTYNLEFLVVDKDDKQPIPDAEIIAKADFLGKSTQWMTKTGVDGKATLENIPYCANIDILANAEGYHNDSIFDEVKNLIGDDITKRQIKLRPQKALIKFIVRDLSNKQLLANAVATLKIQGQTDVKARTNTNGVGVGVFDSIRITAQFTIIVQKSFYHDTSKTANVADFVKLNDEQRTFYLRPSKQNISFRNIDSKTNKPLSGVKNEIFVNGKKHSEEFSNADGTFLIAGVFAEDMISINASKSGYKDNKTTIQNKKFNDLIKASQNQRDIPLEPIPPPPPPPPPPNKDDDFKGEGGDMRINLQWSTYDDLDLLVTDPCGNTIWALELSHNCRGGKGTLDVDANTNRYPKNTWTRKAQENMFWKEPTKGKYIIKVEHCNKQDTQKPDPVSFNITVIYKNQRTDYKGSIREKQKNYVATFEVK